MKRNKLAICLWIGAMSMMLNFLGCSGGLKYKNYSCNDSELDVTMDYVAGWEAREERGAYGSYAQVLFVEPVKKGKSLRAMISLTTKNESKVEFKPADLDALEQDLLSKRLQLTGAKKQASSQVFLFGLKARILEVTYSLPDNPERLDAKMIPLRERIVFFKRQSRFYILRYVNEAKEFRRFEQAFMRCLRTFQFKTTP